VCVEQPAKFDDPDKHGEEEETRYRELGYRRTSFTFFEHSIRQSSPPA
jgi:hypothetical protein